MTRRELLLLAAPGPLGLAILPASASSRRNTRSSNASTRGVAWLLAQQSRSTGLWTSRTYGLLRSGQSLTPFVLHSLVPYRPALPVPVGQLSPDAAIGDYPTYSASLSVLSGPHFGWRGAPAAVSYLLSRQFQEAQGWKEDDPAFGGWGLGGDLRTPPNPGHVDLSMTRYALQALNAAGLPPDHPAFQRARLFLERCQNGDGGFRFSPVVLDANKVGGNRSYGTATADGILSLIATGLTSSGPRLDAAKSWLVAHHRPDAAPGFPGNAAYARWPQGLRFYYAAASAEVFRRTGLPRDHEQDRLLAAEARPDGSWANPEPLVKEDDPLIATGFALQALC